MASSSALERSKKRRPVAARRGKSKAKKIGLALQATPGSFTYRGLQIRPTFVNDSRVERLEKAMREIALKTHVLVE